MPSFPCPYCGRAVTSESDAGRVERCPGCAGDLVLGYRYRLVGAHGKVSGGELYEGVDDIFGGAVGVLFVAEPKDRQAVARFIEGNRLFGELGGGRGLAKLRELGVKSRAHVVIDWFGHGTLDQVVRQRGPIDQATLLELVGDLLVGLGKAHRSMPSLIHGHIHPGKIGFVSADQAVLFGFEHARQLFAQDSHLADAFVAEAEPDSGPTRATDLQQLGLALFYAATGEWPGKQALHEQVARVNQRLAGPLATVLVRMIGAGVAGYESSIEALHDFDHLLAGTSKWQARARTTSTARQAELDEAAWTPSEIVGQPYTTDHGHDDDGEDEGEGEGEGEGEDGDGYEDEDEEHIPDFDDHLTDILESESSDVAPRVEPRSTNFSAAGQLGRHKPWTPPAVPPKPAGVNGARIMGVLVGVLVAFGMCVGALDDDDDRDSLPPPPSFSVPPVPEFEPIPMPEFEPVPTPQIIDQAGVPSGIHHYSGTITGPENLAGLSLGTACDVWVEPNEGTLNCRFYIDCGDPRRRIYGGGDAGYTTCQVEDGHPTIATDENQDAFDGSFMAVFSGVDPIVMVQDRWLQPPTRVLINVFPGGPDPGPVPDVKLAKRRSREHIEAAIARGELPEF